MKDRDVQLEGRPRTLLEHANEWLGAPLYENPSRLEFLLILALFAWGVWMLARSWGWHEGVAQGVRLERRRQDARPSSDFEKWHEQQRAQLREDIAEGVAAGLATHENGGRPRA